MRWDQNCNKCKANKFHCKIEGLFVYDKVGGSKVQITIFIKTVSAWRTD
jgi:hypothetical protein